MFFVIERMTSRGCRVNKKLSSRSRKLQCEHRLVGHSVGLNPACDADVIGPKGGEAGQRVEPFAQGLGRRALTWLRWDGNLPCLGVAKDIVGVGNAPRGGVVDDLGLSCRCGCGCEGPQ